MDLLNSTGKRVRALREQHDLTQGELARRLAGLDAPIGHPQISRIECDLARPSVPVLRALAQALGTSTDFLTLLSDNPYPEAERHAAANG